MEIKYYRDSSHNYLVIECENSDADDFQVKMLENNTIEGILPFSIRNIDGQSYIYYEIDSKQSLDNRYGSGKKMSYEKLCSFAKALSEVSNKLGEYFLDEEHLIMRKDCIFENLSTGTFSFLYFPGNESEKMTGLTDLFLEIADMEDEKAVAFAYKLSDNLSGNGGMSAIFLEDMLMEEEETGDFSEDYAEPSYDEGEEENEDPLEEDEEEEEIVERRIIKIRIPSMFSYFLAILFALVAGALWYLRMVYVLTAMENILDISVFMVSVMMSLICLIQGVTNKKKKPSKDPDYVDDEDADAGDEDLYKYEDEKKDKTFSAINIENDKRADSLYGEKRERDVCADIDEENEETVFLNMDFGHTIHKLYRTSGSKSGNISLETVPLTIGKLSEYADAVLKDPTVSRLHAKIFKSGEDYYVQDLNSKNGTFVNGKRLLPNEKLILFPEDEVTFGKCTFSYR